MNMIDQMINAHGGMGMWTKFERIIVTLSFGGWAFRLKGSQMRTRRTRLIISLDQPMVVIRDFPCPGSQGIFTPDHTWIESETASEIHRYHPEEIIKMFSHSIFWDDLDLLYFVGYACWNYFNIPFLFAHESFQFEELPDWVEQERKLKRVKVTFPVDIPTHCRCQIFYIDAFDRIFRHDYDPTSYASWAKAAHYCFDYRRFYGIWLPTKRIVRPRNRNGTVLRFPELVKIEVHEVHFQ
ncbi:MAG: hypothetical protein KDC80_28000 [Saprospiraceae bacterium]|nr:hypothetical protein [Saprospiraceae bacterium]